jgi:hypothetical protein
MKRITTLYFCVDIYAAPWDTISIMGNPKLLTRNFKLMRRYWKTMARDMDQPRSLKMITRNQKGDDDW